MTTNARMDGHSRAALARQAAQLGQPSHWGLTTPEREPSALQPVQSLRSWQPVILAIDPGPERSGWVVYDGQVVRCGTSDNIDLVTRLPRRSTLWGVPVEYLAIEMIASYGMAVGREVFETCVWIGRFLQAWPRPEEVQRVERRDVKLALCGTARAKDTNVRQALIDRVGKPGTKRQPGPTYGVKGHIWSALAVAVVSADQRAKAQQRTG